MLYCRDAKQVDAHTACKFGWFWLIQVSVMKHLNASSPFESISSKGFFEDFLGMAIGQRNCSKLIWPNGYRIPVFVEQPSLCKYTSTGAADLKGALLGSGQQM